MKKKSQEQKQELEEIVINENTKEKTYFENN